MNVFTGSYAAVRKVRSKVIGISRTFEKGAIF